MEKVTFIINPVSGRSRRRDLDKWITGELDLQHFEPEIIESAEAGEATRITAERIRSGTGIIVAVGGDGTVNEVAKAVVNTPALLGIIPSGSGNGLARHLKVPLSPRKAIHTLNHRNWARMDYATINGTPFFCTSGLGFDAKVGYLFASQRKRGFFTYFKIAVTEFFKYQARTYTIRVNGVEKIREAYVITFANASQYGNNAFIAPCAEVGDGFLDLCIIHKIPRYRVWEMGFRMILKQLPGSRYYETMKVKEARITCPDPVYIHYDGEPGEPVKDIQVNIFPGALKVIVPPCKE